MAMVVRCWLRVVRQNRLFLIEMLVESLTRTAKRS
jgi:hypothetical protein